MKLIFDRIYYELVTRDVVPGIRNAVSPRFRRFTIPSDNSTKTLSVV